MCKPSEGDSWCLIPDKYCHILGLIATGLFFLTSFKSLYDLVVVEIIYKKVPWYKWTFRKLFHVLLPITQILYLVCTLYFDAYCINMSAQNVVHTFLTAGASYLLAICFVLNALHWAFLTYEITFSLLIVTVAFGIIFFYFIVPLVLLILIASCKEIISKGIHKAEVYYHSSIDLGAIIVTVVGWIILKRRVKEAEAPLSLQRLPGRLTFQMILCMIFYSFRCFVLFVIPILKDDKSCDEDDTNSKCLSIRILYFCSSILGDIPLAWTLLHFLEYQKSPEKESPRLRAVNNSEYARVNEPSYRSNLIGEEERKPSLFYLEEGVDY